MQVEGLLEAFNGREWVPVSSILARLTSSNAFGASAARVAGSSSVIFQVSPIQNHAPHEYARLPHHT